jgi:hypothetical protein
VTLLPNIRPMGAFIPVKVRVGDVDAEEGRAACKAALTLVDKIRSR